MKTTLGVFLVVALFGFSLRAAAHEMNHMHAAPHASATLTGEVVDTGCYLGEGERGEGHLECATQCIQQGMPMGLLTKQGKLYLVTMNHDNPDAYNKLKKMAGKMVTVTGVIMTRQGMKGIDIVSFKPAA